MGRERTGPIPLAMETRVIVLLALPFPLSPHLPSVSFPTCIITGALREKGGTCREVLSAHPGLEWSGKDGGQHSWS